MLVTKTLIKALSWPLRAAVGYLFASRERLWKLQRCLLCTVTFGLVAGVVLYAPYTLYAAPWVAAVLPELLEAAGYYLWLAWGCGVATFACSLVLDLLIRCGAGGAGGEERPAGGWSPTLVRVSG